MTTHHLPRLAAVSFLLLCAALVSPARANWLSDRVHQSGHHFDERTRQNGRDFDHGVHHAAASTDRHTRQDARDADRDLQHDGSSLARHIRQDGRHL